MIINDTKHRSFILGLLLTLMVVIPTIPLVRFLVPIPGFGAIKEVIGFAIIFFSLIVILARNDTTSPIYFQYDEIIVLIYILYFFSHLIIKNTDDFSSIILVIKYHMLNLIVVFIFYKFYKVIKLDKDKVVKYIFKCTYMIGALVSYVGVYESFFPEKIKNIYGERSLHSSYMGLSDIRLVSTMENPINLGYFMVISLIFGYYFYNNYKVKINKLICFLNILCFYYVCLLTLSRTAYVMMAVVTFFYLGKSFMNSNLKKKLALVFGVIISLLGFMLIISGKISIFSSRISQFSLEEVGRDLRFLTWQRAIKEITDDVVILFYGKGFGLLGWDTGSFVMENGYLSIIYELGVIGLILFFIILIFNFNNIFVVLMNKRYLKESKEIAFVAFLLLMIFLIAMVTSDAHMDLPFSFFFWLFYFITKMNKEDGVKLSENKHNYNNL